MLVIKNAPTTVISDVISRSMMRTSFMCRLRNMAWLLSQGMVRTQPSARK